MTKASKASKSKPVRGELRVEVTGNGPELAPTGTALDLTVSVNDGASAGEVIRCGFRQNMFEIDEDGPGKGSMDTGAGCGNDNIVMRWKGRNAIVRGRDLFKAWVATFAPEDAERMP